MKKGVKALVIISLLLLIDQTVKSFIVTENNINLTLIPGWVRLSYIKNSGGAYGLGADNRLILIVINLLLIFFMIKYLVNNFKTMNIEIILSLLLILSGGISNLTDRLLRGYVVDYIDINEFIKFPVFNIADIYIVTGTFIMVVTILISTVKEQENTKKG